jgi:hypothetical protein
VNGRDIPRREPVTKRGRTCPSGRCEEGAVLLGIVGSNGVVGYVQPALPISDEFVEEARQRGEPERRFRFAQPCLEGGCTQWTENRCGVIDRVLSAKDASGDTTVTAGLPECSIRPSCRWFAQAGARACAVCPLVITDSQDRGLTASLVPADD